MPEPEYRQALPTGYHIDNYRLVEVLGAGGFGITYRAEDTSLNLSVAIKEYLPNEFAVREGTSVHPKSRGDQESFRWGRDRFVDEARTLALFKHRNLVRVTRYFETNNTAYIVMDYEVGEPLHRLLDRRDKLSQAQLLQIIVPIAQGLKVVHSAGYLHRDIKPANIFVRREDESPVLLDFGAARFAMGGKTRSMTAIASAGYSPPEQYYGAEGEQGAWTDIYSLSAVCYRAISGAAPEEAPRRQGRLLRGEPDPLPKLMGRTDGYATSVLQAVDAGLELVETRRPADLDAWLEMVAKANDSPVEFRKPAAPTADRGATESKQSPVAGVSAGAWLAATATATVAFAASYLLLLAGIDGSAAESPMADPQPFEVLSTPPMAKVEFTDGDTPYEAGTPLAAGTYTVEISAEGYDTAQASLHHDARPTRHRVALDPSPAPFTIVPFPADADIELTSGAAGARGTSHDYADGIALPAGQYRVRVAHAGHETVEFSVLHGEQATRKHVTLSTLGNDGMARAPAARQ